MSHNNGLIRIPINVASDIGEVLGTGSGDVGTNCTCSSLNIFSKYKPNNLIGWNPQGDAEYINRMKTNRFALYGQSVTVLSELPIKALQGWIYTGPNTVTGQKYYRVMDFDKYYHNAPCPFMQANGKSMILDLLNPDATVMFYLLMANGRYANSKFSSGGMDKTARAVPSDLLQYCICIDSYDAGDLGLGFYGESGGYQSLLGAYCGVVVYTKLGNTYTYKTELFNNEAQPNTGDFPISNSYQQDQNEMFRIPLKKLLDKTGGEMITNGIYYIVPCAKKVVDTFSYYMPVYNNINYPAVIELKVGLDNYKQEIISYEVGDSTSELRITMRLYNNSSKAVTILDNNTDKSKIGLKAVINTPAGTSIHGNTGSDEGWELNNEIRTALPTIPTNGNITIPANSYLDIVYEIDRIWYPTGGTISGDTIIDSGTITVAPTLQYNNSTNYGWYSGSNVRNFTWTY